MLKGNAVLFDLSRALLNTTRVFVNKQHHINDAFYIQFPPAVKQFERPFWAFSVLVQLCSNSEWRRCVIPVWILHNITSAALGLLIALSWTRQWRWALLYFQTLLRKTLIKSSEINGTGSVFALRNTWETAFVLNSVTMSLISSIC